MDFPRDVVVTDSNQAQKIVKHFILISMALVALARPAHAQSFSGAVHDEGPQPVAEIHDSPTHRGPVTLVASEQPVASEQVSTSPAEILSPEASGGIEGEGSSAAQQAASDSNLERIRTRIREKVVSREELERESEAKLVVPVKESRSEGTSSAEVPVQEESASSRVYPIEKAEVMVRHKYTPFLELKEGDHAVFKAGVMKHEASGRAAGRLVVQTREGVKNVLYQIGYAPKLRDVKTGDFILVDAVKNRGQLWVTRVQKSGFHTLRIVESEALPILSFWAFSNVKWHAVTKHTVLAGFVISILYAGGNEFYQSFVPNRTPDVVDFLANVLGVLLGTIAYLIANRLIPRKKLA